MRPRVILNMAPSLDGKIAPVRRTGPWVMSRHPEDEVRLRRLRERTGATIVGAKNVEMDDPDLAPAPIRVVVTRSGENLPASARMFSASVRGEAVVAHASEMPEARRAVFGRHATLVELGSGRVDVSRLLAWLAKERGCRDVVCEGGGALAASFLAAGAIDEVRLTIVPRLLGGSAAPGVLGGEGFEPDAVPDPRLESVERVGDELFLVYRIDWP